MPSFVNSAFAYLQGWAATFEQHYREGVADGMRRFGRTTRIMPMRNVRLQGNNIEYEVKAHANRSTRVTRSLMDPMPDPGPGEYLRFNVNFDHTDPAANDFAAFEIGFRTTIWDIWKRSDRTFKDSPDFVRKDVQEGIDDVKETFAKYIHLPVDGKLADVNATPRNDDSDIFADATTLTVDATTALIQLQPASMARIGDGQLIDIYDSTGSNLRVSNVRVRYVHPHEETIAVETTTDSGGAADFDTVAANDTIFLAGSKDQSPRGTLAHLFDPTQAYYGRGRLPGQAGQTYAAVNRMLIPIRIFANDSATAAAVPLTGDHFRFVGEQVAWQEGGSDAVRKRAMVMSRYEFRAVSRIARDEGITMTPALESEVGRKLNKAFGFDGFVLHDPNLGSSMIVIDDFAEPGQIDFLNMQWWEIVNPIDGGFRMFPGEIAGIWSRNTEDDGTGRPAKVYSANGVQVVAFVCRWPKGQVRLAGLTTT